MDVWTGGREVARKVSLCHLFLPTQAEKPDPTGSDACLSQQEVVLQGLSQSPSTPKSTRGSMLHHPHSYPTGLEPKHETDEIFLW